MAKPHKASEEECEECPEWIFTFADLVMLMMGFFVILWVLKPPAGHPEAGSPQQQQEQWLETVSQIRGGFGWEPDPTSTDPVDQYVIRRRHMANPGDGSRTERERRGPHGEDPEVTTIRPGKQAVVGGALTFDPGSATLSQSNRAALDTIATEIRGHRNIVLVKGHTALDDLPETSTAQEKMDLSLRRAQAVADYLTTHGVEPEILRVQGCSTFEPVVQRAYSPESQAVNRRVDVDVTATLVPDLQDPAKPAPEVQSVNP